MKVCLLEASRELTLMNSSDFQKQIVNHAKQNPEEEVCGFIVLCEDLSVRVVPAINENPNKSECFSISPQKFISTKLNNKILAIYHSHPKGNCFPSDRDRNASKEMGIPYLIYGLKNDSTFLYYPESYEPDELIGRPYITGIYECTSLFKDYFIKNLNLNITEWNENYWLPQKDHEANRLLMNILSSRANKVTLNQLQEHDIIVFQPKRDKRFHVGIYTGNDYFIHQPMHNLSSKQILDDRWQSKIKHVYRHPSLV